MSNKIRCPWTEDIPIYIDYHDNEWGRPVHDDTMLFEFLILEGMQAGLSWITILKKRENFRAAFDGFDPNKVALYDESKINELMTNAGIIRHRGKIEAAINNAKIFLGVAEKHGSFDKLIWSYVNNNASHRHGKRPFDFMLGDIADNMDLTRIPNPTDKDKERITKYREAADRINDALPYAEAIPDCRLIEIDGVAEVHPNITLDQFSDMFIRFIESHGWFFGGGYKDVTDEQNGETVSEQ